MGNPILEQLDRRNLQRQNSSNPRLQQVQNYVNQHGGDPKTAFYNACQERGINPNDILKFLQGGRNYG